jgi:transcriptional regulator with XRE-family HTH domain
MLSVPPPPTLRGAPLRLRSREHLMQCIGTSLGWDTSATELAHRAGLNPRVVQYLLSGQRVNCKPSTARAISEAVGIPLAELFASEPVRRSPEREGGAA